MLYAPLIIWIGVIFFFSSGQGASTRTSLIIRPILEYLFPTASFETIAFYHGIVRKCAHLVEYAILGILACRAFSRWTTHFVLVGLGFVLLIASLDEFNQSFNPQRTSTPWDVALDFAGGVLGVVLFALITRKKRLSA